MKLSVLFVNSIGKSKWGGGEKWMLNTAKSLAELGHAVQVAVRKNSVLEKKAKEMDLPVVSISYHTDFSVSGVLKFRGFFRTYKTDVVVCCLNRDVRVAGMAARQVKSGPKVLARQGVQLIKDKWKYKVTFTKLADGIITNSQSLKQIYDSFGWWGNDFVRVIYNGVQRPTEITNYDFNKVADVNGYKIILAAGRLNEQKGFEYLVEAARKAKQVGKNWKFFIAGEGKERERLQSMISEYQLDSFVYLIGFQENIFSLFSMTDVFVLPSLYEGMPNVLLEAMLAGLPVVATPVNGTAELINDYENGLLVPVKDGEAIYNKIDELLSDSQLSRKIANNGKNFVEENFSQNKSATKVEWFMNDLIQKK